MDCPPAPARMRDMSDVTQVLSAIEHGDPSAAGELLPLVYDKRRSWRRPSWRTSSNSLVNNPGLIVGRRLCGDSDGVFRQTEGFDEGVDRETSHLKVNSRFATTLMTDRGNVGNLNPPVWERLPSWWRSPHSTSTNDVSEPATMAIWLLLGPVGVGIRRRKRHAKYEAVYRSKQSPPTRHDERDFQCSSLHEALLSPAMNSVCCSVSAHQNGC
jgi:hypothetical protein